mmetsp:Transcript_21937/g.39494  ORF Transcript_21937/g.39494 Transcript_21937/m.39494 type:complete len:233 (-) Transcript_21937:449-1147(-)
MLDYRYSWLISESSKAVVERLGHGQTGFCQCITGGANVTFCASCGTCIERSAFAASSGILFLDTREGYIQQLQQFLFVLFIVISIQARWIHLRIIHHFLLIVRQHGSSFHFALDSPVLAITVKHLPESYFTFASPFIFTFSIPKGNNRLIQIILLLDILLFLRLQILLNVLRFLPQQLEFLFNFIHFFINDILRTGYHPRNMGFHFDSTQCHLEFHTPTKQLCRWFLDECRG